MTRILSALVLLPLVLGTVWYLPPVATLGLAEVAALLAFVEYASLAEHLGAPFPRVLAGTAVMACCAAIGLGLAPSADILLAALIAIAAAAVGFGRPGPTVLPGVAAAIFAPVYLGLPLGALAAVRAVHGRGAVLALMLTVMASDSAQYYCGRLVRAARPRPVDQPEEDGRGGRRRRRRRRAGARGGRARLAARPRPVACWRWWAPRSRRSASSATCSSRCSSAAPA